MPLSISWKFWNWGENGVQLHPHFFTYPALMFYLHYAVHCIHYAVGYFIGMYADLSVFQNSFAENPTHFIVLARIVSLLFDIGTIFFTYNIALRLWNKTCANVAVVFLAINPLHIQQAHLINVDTPLTFFAVCAVYAALRVFESGKMQWYIFAGISIGCAAATKYNGALLGLPLFLAHMLKHQSSLADFSRHRVFLLSAVCTVGVFLLSNPYIVMDFQSFREEFVFVQWHMEVGHLGLDENQSTLGYYFFDSLPRNFGWLMTFGVIAGSAMMVYKRKREFYILLSFPLVFVAMLLTWKMRADRYIIPAFPFFILCGTYALYEGWNALHTFAQKFSFTKNRFVVHSVACMLLIVILFPSLAETYSYQRHHTLPDTRLETKHWIQQNIQKGAAIAYAPLGISLDVHSYKILPIPFSATLTKQFSAFYNYEWYRDFDVVLGSTFDYGRYVKEPHKYSAYIAYYDALRTQSQLLFESAPNDLRNGPHIWVYAPMKNFRSEKFSDSLLQSLHTVGDAQVITFAGKLAAILGTKNQIEKSEQLLATMVAIDPTNQEVRRGYIFVLYQEEKYEEALRAAQIFLRIYPQHPEMTGLLGNILLQLEHFEEAEQVLLSAITLDAQRSEPYLDLAILYETTGNYTQAVTVLNKYMMTFSLSAEEKIQIAEKIAALREVK